MKTSSPSILSEEELTQIVTRARGLYVQAIAQGEPDCGLERWIARAIFVHLSASPGLNPAREEAWQLIETAPKDGTPILLWLKTPISRSSEVSGLCDFLVIGFWQHQRFVSIEVEDCGSMGGEMTGWMTDWCPLDVDPSHWMSIPDVPRALGSRDKT